MDIETKLRRFSDVVLKEAEELKKKQSSVLDVKYETNVTDFEKRTKSKYAEMLEDATISAERRKQKEIAQKNADIKKSLIQKRTAYINDIFDNVNKRLEEFFRTPEYEELIVGLIMSYKDKNGDCGMTACIMRRDMALAPEIEKKTGVSVAATDEDFLGGVKILLGGNRIADCTLRRKLEHEKTGFNKIRII